MPQLNASDIILFILGLLALGFIVQAISNRSVPDTIEQASAGTMLIHTIEDGGQPYIESRENTEEDEYYRQECAASWLATDKVYKVEIKDPHGQIHRYTRQSIHELGW